MPGHRHQAHVWRREAVNQELRTGYKPVVSMSKHASSCRALQPIQRIAIALVISTTLPATLRRIRSTALEAGQAHIAQVDLEARFVTSSVQQSRDISAQCFCRYWRILPRLHLFPMPTDAADRVAHRCLSNPMRKRDEHRPFRQDCPHHKRRSRQKPIQPPKSGRSSESIAPTLRP
jgi:hypothetical protein